MSILARNSKLRTEAPACAYFWVSGTVLDAIKPFLNHATDTNGPYPLTLLLSYGLANLAALSGSAAAVVLISREMVRQPIIAVILASVGVAEYAIVAPGVIQIFVHLAIGGVAGLSLFLGSLLFELAASLVADRHLSQVTLSSIKEDVWTILKLVLQVLLSLGAITGVCMTILFDGGFESLAYKLNAVELIIALGACGGGAYVFVIAPCRSALSLVRRRETETAVTA